MFASNPRELKRLLKRMGVEVEELEDARQVEIVLKDKRIVLRNPQILVFKAGGQVFYQVTGAQEVVEEAGKPAEPLATEIPEDDIRFVMEQTGASYEKAREALVKSRGDILQAIMMLKGE
ncbi:MAG: nascent polypeptide-associated complex protein [Desulfurococcus sp.]|nr:nascent polypeptide-associated complex protein [Desulfurococcus sp.]